MATFYQVGGSVRDELLGLKSKDIDYAVEADSFDDMRDAVLSRGGEIFQERPQFVTLRAKVPGLGACDYVLCRKDGYYTDGRHPDVVEVGTILDDLARRDFTINAIAKTEDGTLIDPHGGQIDLANKFLRCVGDAHTRFTEDGLRMVRAIRFKITKGLTGTDNNIHECLGWPDFFETRLDKVTIEQIREELVRCFAHDSYKTMITLMFYYQSLTKYLFERDGLWLKPTLEAK